MRERDIVCSRGRGLGRVQCLSRGQISVGVWVMVMVMVMDDCSGI